METAIEEKKAVAGDGRKIGKRKWWDVLLVVGAAIAILISRQFK